MESALPVQPKIRSPAVSAASKEEPKEATPLDESPDADSTSGVKAINIDMSSSDKKATTIPDVAEGTMKSKNVKEDKPLEVTLTKESQEKLPGGEQGESPSVLFLFHSSPCLCHSLLYNLIAIALIPPLFLISS
jgi:E3 ubiquitin-protein ligase RBBP6